MSRAHLFHFHFFPVFSSLPLSPHSVRYCPAARGVSMDSANLSLGVFQHFSGRLNGTLLFYSVSWFLIMNSLFVLSGHHWPVQPRMAVDKCHICAVTGTGRKRTLEVSIVWERGGERMWGDMIEKGNACGNQQESVEGSYGVVLFLRWGESGHYFCPCLPPKPSLSP